MSNCLNVFIFCCEFKFIVHKGNYHCVPYYVMRAIASILPYFVVNLNFLFRVARKSPNHLGMKNKKNILKFAWIFLSSRKILGTFLIKFHFAITLTLNHDINVFNSSRARLMDASSGPVRETLGATGTQEVKRAFINPLSPNISMHFLLTVLHIFLMGLVGRICIKIKTFYLWGSFPVF